MKSELRTQKARGLRVIYCNSKPFSLSDGVAISVLKYVGVADAKVLETSGREGWKAALKFSDRGVDTHFARPCPTRPRHGFVESRVLDHNNLDAELQKVGAETAAADPDGEVILMPHIEAAFSAVLANGALAIGPSNDGATGGKDSVSIPAVAPALDDDISKAAGIENAPYVEYVYPINSNFSSWGGPIPVQLRDGPAVSNACATRWAPRSMYVGRVIRSPEASDPTGLLEWEKRVQTLTAFESASCKGDVVWIPGGNLGCHAAVHAVLNGITVVCDAEAPKVGSIIEKTLAETLNNKLDLAQLRAGLLAGLQDEDGLKVPYASRDAVAAYPAWAAPVLAGLYLTHNTSAIPFGKPQWSWILGWTVAGMTRLAVTACIGESRYGILRHHHDGFRAGMKRKRISREAAYDMVIGRGLDKDTLKKFARARTLFSVRWINNEGSIGGKKWLECADASLSLWNLTIAALDGFIARDGAEAVILGAMNRLINICHNGAKMLTKFVHPQVFDRCANYPWLAAVAAGPTIYNLLKEISHGEEKAKQLPLLDVPSPVNSQLAFISGNIKYPKRRGQAI